MVTIRSKGCEYIDRGDVFVVTLDTDVGASRDTLHIRTVVTPGMGSNRVQVVGITKDEIIALYDSLGTLIDWMEEGDAEDDGQI